jgi:nicotinamidase/pyrazinamidase
VNKNNLNLTKSDRIVTIAVDVQNDFCPGGALAVTEGSEVVKPLNEVMALTRRLGGQVIATRDWHPDQTPHFNDWPIGEEAGVWPRHCVADTAGAAFHQNLNLKPDDIIINKGTGQTDGYSGFEGVSEDGITIEQLIQPRTPKERVVVFFGGLATDFCVKATGLDGAIRADDVRKARQGYIEMICIEDAIRAVNLNEGDDEKAIAEMESAGIKMITSAEVLQAMAQIEV